MKALCIVTAAGLMAGGADAAPDRVLPQPGAYEVEVRVEIPNVWNWAAAETVTICLPQRGRAPLPVLSRNNPLAGCPAEDVKPNGSALTYAIVCPGRDGAKARAAYLLSPEAFRGRIRMVMGAKNMTLTEVQTGRRVGECQQPSIARRAAGAE
jgi:hypothetical protein